MQNYKSLRVGMVVLLWLTHRHTEDSFWPVILSAQPAS